MSVTAYTLPREADQSVKGATLWVNLSRIVTDDDSSANNGFVVGDDFIERHAYLVIGGAIVGTNKGGDTVLGSPWSKTYGGAADLWGNTITPAIVNSTDFGVAFAIGKKTVPGAVKTDMSYYAIGTDFGFNIPSDATINGIEVIAEGDKYNGGGGTDGIYLDSLQLRVHYTWAPKVRAVGSSSGFVYTPLVQGRPDPDKKFRHVITDPSGAYVGEWRKVKDPPSFKQDLNNLHSSMNIVLEQNEEATEPTVEDLLTESDESLLTEADEQLLADLAATSGLGPGTDTEVNNELQIISYYGQFVELLTEDGQPILTEDDEIIMVEDGAPQGKSLFTGYIPEWELDFGESEDVTVPILTHSQELNNIMLETADVLKVDAGEFTNNYYGLKGSGPDDTLRLCQTFTMVGTVPVNHIRLQARQVYVDLGVPVTLTLTNGTVPGTPGTTLATAVATITPNPDDINEWQNLDFVFEEVDLTNGTTYEFFLDVPEYATKTGGNPTYPVQFQAGGAYSGGSLSAYVKPTPSWTTLSEDLRFQVYQPGGETTVAFNSMDPSAIFRAIIDYARSRGARVSYTGDSVEDTGTTVSVEFKANTIEEALLAVLKYCPADWYEYYDFGDNVAHLHPRPTEPAHVYVKGKDVSKLKIKRSIIGLINDIYFSGGKPIGLDENIFIRKSDFSSIQSWRRGLKKLSDNRVKTEDGAEILTDAEIERYGQPVYSGTMTVLEVDFPIEDIAIGELSGFSGWGDLVDILQLQNVSTTYYPEKRVITLSILLPKVPKRIEDIRRNLDAQETENNPVSPTVV